MDRSTKLATILKVQELAKREIMDGDMQSAKFLLIKAKELLISLHDDNSSEKAS